MLAGCTMGGSLEPNSLEGLTAEKGWSALSRTNSYNAYIKSASNPDFYLGLDTRITLSGPTITTAVKKVVTKVVMNKNQNLWTVKELDSNTYTIGKLELRQGGGTYSPIEYFLVGDSSTPTRWTITEIQPGNYTISSGDYYLAAKLVGGECNAPSCPIPFWKHQAWPEPTVSRTPYIWSADISY